MNHEEEGVAPAAAFLDRLNVHSIDGRDVRGQVLGLVAHHLEARHAATKCAKN